MAEEDPWGFDDTAAEEPAPVGVISVAAAVEAPAPVSVTAQSH